MKISRHDKLSCLPSEPGIMGNLYRPLIIFLIKQFFDSLENIDNLDWKTVWYPSRKVVEHVFLAVDIITGYRPLTGEKRQIFDLKHMNLTNVGE